MSKNRKYMRKPNGYGGIVKLSGNRRKPYCVRITIGFADDGKQIFKPLGYFETQSEAEKFLALYNADPTKVDTERLTFEQLFKLFWRAKFKYDYDNVPPEHKKNQSEYAYDSAYNYCKLLHKRIYSELSKIDFQIIVDKAVCDGYSQSFVKNLRKLWNGMYKTHDEMRSQVEGYKYVDLSGVKSEKKRENVFFQAELEVISKNKENTLFYDVLVFLLYTGTRINETLRLEKKNVFLEERYFITGSKTEAGKDRKVPIHKKIIPIVKKHLDKPGQYLFMHEDGRELQAMYFRTIMWHPYFERIGLRQIYNFTPHATRHTFISQAKRCGMDDLLKKRIIGHKDDNITDGIYTHTEIDLLIDAIDQFDYDYDFF